MYTVSYFDKSAPLPTIIDVDRFLSLRLRVAKMNNDLKEQDMAYGGDPMFDDILRDLLAFNPSTNEDETN